MEKFTVIFTRFRKVPSSFAHLGYTPEIAIDYTSASTLQDVVRAHSGPTEDLLFIFKGHIQLEWQKGE